MVLLHGAAPEDVPRSRSQVNIGLEEPNLISVRTTEETSPKEFGDRVCKIFPDGHKSFPDSPDSVH